MRQDGSQNPMGPHLQHCGLRVDWAAVQWVEVGGQWWSTLTSSTLGLSLAGADGWCLHRRSVFGGMRLWEDGPAPIYPWSLPSGGRGHFTDGQVGSTGPLLP